MVSQPINIEELKNFINNDTFRLIIKKNKYYKKDSCRPYYNFAIGDSYISSMNTITSKNMQYEELNEMNEYDMREYIEKNYDIKLYTYNELKKVMFEANYDGSQGITDIIVDDYI